MRDHLAVNTGTSTMFTTDETSLIRNIKVYLSWNHFSLRSTLHRHLEIYYPYGIIDLPRLTLLSTILRLAHYVWRFLVWHAHVLLPALYFKTWWAPCDDSRSRRGASTSKTTAKESCKCYSHRQTTTATSVSKTSSSKPHC